MKEHRVIVSKDFNGSYWYTLQVRNVYFLFRGLWKDVAPTWQPSYEDAINLLIKKYEKNKI